MWRYFGCSDDSGIAKAMRNAWTAGVPSVVEEANLLRRNDPAAFEKICAGATTFVFPEKFHEGLTKDDWRPKKSRSKP